MLGRIAEYLFSLRDTGSRTGTTPSGELSWQDLAYGGYGHFLGKTTSAKTGKWSEG